MVNTCIKTSLVGLSTFVTAFTESRICALREKLHQFVCYFFFWKHRGISISCKCHKQKRFTWNSWNGCVFRLGQMCNYYFSILQFKCDDTLKKSNLKQKINDYHRIKSWIQNKKPNIRRTKEEKFAAHEITIRLWTLSVPLGSCWKAVFKFELQYTWNAVNSTNDYSTKE